MAAPAKRSKTAKRAKAAPEVLDEDDVTPEIERKRVAPLLARWNYERFLASGVGLYIWRAYSTYRAAGLEVPEFLLMEFDRWAARLEDAEDAASVARAMDLATGRDDGKVTGPQRKARMRLVDQQWNVVRFVTAMQRWSIEPAEAYRLAAREFNKSEHAIRKQVDRWRQQMERHLSPTHPDDSSELLRMLGKPGRG